MEKYEIFDKTHLHKWLFGGENFKFFFFIYMATREKEKYLTEHLHKRLSGVENRDKNMMWIFNDDWERKSMKYFTEHLHKRLLGGKNQETNMMWIIKWWLIKEKYDISDKAPLQQTLWRWESSVSWGKEGKIGNCWQLTSKKWCWWQKKSKFSKLWTQSSFMGSLTSPCIAMVLANRAIKDDIVAFANYHPSSCANISFKYIPHACL